MSNSRVGAAAMSGAVSGFVPGDMSLLVQDRLGTADQLAETVRQLMLENTDLKNTVQTNNKTMKDAHELFASFERRANQERSDHAANYEQVKNIVTGLKKKIMDQEQVINAMKQKSAQPLQPSDELNTLHAQISTLTTDVYLKSSQITQITQERDELRRSLDAAQAEVNSLSETHQKARLDIQQLAADYHEQLLANDDLKQKETEMKQDLQRMWTEKKENEGRIDNLTAQLYSAEDTLAMKDENIRAKNKEIDDLAVLAAQADIYKADFQAERQSREELNDKKMALEDRVKALEDELHLRASPLAQVHHPTQPAYQEVRNNTLPRNGNWLDRPREGAGPPQRNPEYGPPQGSQNWSQIGGPMQQPNDEWAQSTLQQRPVRHPASYTEARPPPARMEAQHEAMYAPPAQHNTGGQQHGGASYANINDMWQSQQQLQQNLYPNLRQSPSRQLINLREDPASGSLPNSAAVSETVVPENLPRTVVQALNSGSPEHSALQTTMITEHKCPFCNLEAPDLDSLQLHINDLHPD